MTVNVSDWSTSEASNTTCGGVNIGENCSPGGLNNAIRAVMAGVRGLYDTVAALSTTVSGKLSAAGAVFTGTQPIYTGRGAYLHHSSASNTSGKIDFLPEGSANPSSPSAGDLVFFYS